MLKISDKNIKEISDTLDSGMRCFYNQEKEEIIAFPDFENNPYAERSMWRDVTSTYEKQRDQYIEFEKMDTRGLFRVMAHFIDVVDETILKDRLITALNRPKPYKNFKNEIDYSGEYRDKWFQFRDQANRKWIKEQINMFNGVDDEDLEINIDCI